MNVILTDYLYKLILPGWVLNLTTKFRQVRDGFDEIRVCVYILRQQSNYHSFSSFTYAK